MHTPGLSDQLIENELFGHRKGAYTGADRDTDGFVSQANGGTLFLDEIGDISYNFQVKLLRFIETGCYTRVGEAEERRVNVRVIAATNRDLAEEVLRGRFRQDLYYRLNVLTIEVPPLRKRTEDIEAIIAESKDILNGKKLTQDGLNVIMKYDWPGNIRQLRNVLRKAAIIIDKKEIGAEIERLIQDEKNLLKNNSDGKVKEIWGLIEKGGDFWEVVRKPFLKRDLNRSEVKLLLKKALAETGGSYRRLLSKFNLSDGEYKRFMNFLGEHNLKDKNNGEK